MRKFLLSAFVILSFVFYTVHKRLEVDATTSAVGSGQQEALAQPTIPPAEGAGGKPADPKSNTGVPASPPPTVIPTPLPVKNSQYRDGQFTGDLADAYYGNIQVAVTISGGKITDVAFLDYPKDRKTSIQINTQAMPYLKQEAIAAQGANVDIVSGATDSSRAFIQSLGSALAKAKS